MGKTMRTQYTTILTHNTSVRSAMGFVMRKAPRSKLVGDMRDKETQAVVRKARTGEYDQ
jgi:Tfp pilus assembly pilus retraction ATPase PilT